jgi:hypothetical protein
LPGKNTPAYSVAALAEEKKSSVTLTNGSKAITTLSFFVSCGVFCPLKNVYNFFNDLAYKES